MDQSPEKNDDLKLKRYYTYLSPSSQGHTAAMYIVRYTISFAMLNNVVVYWNSYLSVLFLLVVHTNEHTVYMTYVSPDPKLHFIRHLSKSTVRNIELYT